MRATSLTSTHVEFSEPSGNREMSSISPATAAILYGTRG